MQIDEKNIPRVQEVFKRVKSDIYYYGVSTFSRFLPNIFDGFKPVVRRILYTIWSNNITKSVKVSKLAGLTVTYHPHGDVSISNTIIKMAQEGTTANYALLFPEGQFGTISDLSAASPRYISTRVSDFGYDAVISLMDTHTIELTDAESDFGEKEPKYLPTKIPIVLLNGSLGIVESFTSNIPQHNLIDIANVIIKYIKNKNISAREMSYGLYPDYVVGGTIINGDEIHENYYNNTVSKGIVKVRGDSEIDLPGNRIIVRSMPLSFDFDSLVSKVKDILNDKDKSGNPKNLVLSNISYIGEGRDSNDKDPYIYITCKSGTNLVEVLENLYKNTHLEFSNKINLTFSHNGKVRNCTIKEVIEEWYKVNYDDRQRKLIYQINNHENRIHILEGILKVYPNIDNIIAIIRKAKNKDENDDIILKIKNSFGLSLIQARSIFETKIGNLTSRSEKELASAISKLREKIKILASDLKCIDDIMINDLIDLKNKYGRPRRTKVIGKLKERSDIVVSNGAILATRNTIGVFDSTNIISGKRILNGLKGVKIDSKWVKGIINSHKIDDTISSVIVFYSNGSVNSIVPSVINSWIPNPSCEDCGFIKSVTPVYSSINGSVICISSDGMIKRFATEEIGTRVTQSKSIVENSIFVPNSMSEGTIILVNSKGEYLHIKISSVPIQSKNAIGVKTSFSSGKNVRMSITDENVNSFMVLMENTKLSEGYVYLIPISSIKTGSRTSNLKKLYNFQDFVCNGIGCLDINLKDQIALFISDNSTIGLKTTNFRNIDSPRKINCKAFDIITLTI